MESQSEYAKGDFIRGRKRDFLPDPICSRSASLFIRGHPEGRRGHATQFPSFCSPSTPKKEGDASNAVYSNFLFLFLLKTRAFEAILPLRSSWSLECFSLFLLLFCFIYGRLSLLLYYPITYLSVYLRKCKLFLQYKNRKPRSHCEYFVDLLFITCSS